MRFRLEPAALLAFILCLPSEAPASASASAEVSHEVRERFVATRSLMAEEQFSQAWDALRELASEEPTFVPAYRSLMDVSIVLGKEQAMARYLEDRLTENPTDAHASYGLGLVASVSGRLEESIAHHEKALSLRPTFAEAACDRGGIVGFPQWAGLAQVYWKSGRLDQAVAYFENMISSDPESAVGFYGLACVAFIRHDPEAALASGRRALELAPEMIGALTLVNLAQWRVGLEPSLVEPTRELKERAARAAELNVESLAELRLGNMHRFLGDYGRSLRHLTEARRLARAYGQNQNAVAALNDLAAVYGTAGDYTRARALFEQVLEETDPDDLAGIAVTTMNLGHTMDTLDAKREHYERALTLFRQADMTSATCSSLMSIGEVDEQTGDLPSAEAQYREALDCAREVASVSFESHALERLAGVRQRRGEVGEAVRLYENALSIAEASGTVETRWDAEGGLANALEKAGRIEDALSHNMRAIEIYESVRESIDMDSLGSGFLNDKDEVYPAVVRLLARAGRIEEAFTYAERFKAKNLLRSLALSPAQLAQLLPESLRAEFERVNGELRRAHAALATASNEDAATAEGILNDLGREKAALVRELREEHAGFAELIEPDLLDVQSIQSRVLAEDQTLLEYVVGEEDTSVFVVTRDRLEYRLLPVGRARLVELMESWSPVFRARDSNDFDSRLFNASLADFSVPAARELFDALVRPLRDSIPGGTDLIIVPDDVLFYLPFEALVAESAGDGRYDFDGATFLLERHAISYVSASSLLGRDDSDREPAPETLLAMGNPSFEGGSGSGGSPLILPGLGRYASAVLRDNALVPLPYSEQEVRSIARVVGSSESRVATGQSASVALFHREASNYRILHLATHFLMDDSQPLFSKLALSPSADGHDDGFLELHEVLTTRLRADLVVLSACNTGLGRLERGEGMLGATRAFLYAGVPSVVVSLWSVEDRTTSSIMERFYVHLKEGRDKRDALRRAKLDYLETSSGLERDPFFWAPFVLAGDPSPLDLPAPPRTWAWYVVALFLSLLVVMWRRGRVART